MRWYLGIPFVDGWCSMVNAWWPLLPRKDGSMGPGSPLFIRAVFCQIGNILGVFFSRRKKLWKTMV